MNKIIKIIVSMIFTSATALAAQGSGSFIYHGRAYQNNGTSPVNTPVDIVLDIVSNSGCLLYEEKQLNIDLSLTNGALSLQVGSPVGSAVRTSNDSALSMQDVFTNGKRLAGKGCSVTGVDGDGRKLHVSIAPAGGTPVALSPDIPISSVPMAMVADTLQGLNPSNLIQTSVNITQATVESLSAGISTLYAKPSDVATAVSSGTSGLATSASVTSQISAAVSPLAKSSDLTALQSTVSGLPTTAAVNSSIASATAPLASTAYVNSSVAPLATTASVNSQIAALPTNTSVDSKISTAIAPLATTTYVNSSVSSVTGDPSGTVISFAGVNCPSGFLKADGASYLISSYSNLASALYNSSASKYVWGSVDGTHFNVPNMQGVFPRGAGSQTVGGIGYSGSLGSTQSDQMQGHFHSLGDGVGGSAAFGTSTGGAGNTVGSVTGNTYRNVSTAMGLITDGTNGTPRTGLETRPANISLTYCIKN